MYKHAIVLIHGFRGSSVDMIQIHRVLRSTGYFNRIINVDMLNSPFPISNRSYTIGTPIIRFDKNGEPLIEHTIVQFVLSQIVPYLGGIDRLHFLCYSMGGLVGRAILKMKIPLPPIKSMILLATPNLGTEVAGFRKGGFSELFNPTDQLDQMRRNSPFIRWLNSSPIFTDIIPHWRAFGTRNAGNVSNFDGLVSFRDTELFGSRIIGLGEHSDRIDHYNIILWESREPAIEFMRMEILKIYKELTK